MKLFTFFGTILPAAIKVSMDKLPEIHWEEPELKIEFRFIFHIHDSKFSVQVVSPRYDDEIKHAALIRAQDLVTSMVYLLGFQNGWGFYVLMEELVDPGGTKSQLIFEDKRLPEYLVFTRDSKNFPKLLPLIVTNPPLFLALGDLLRSLTHPHASVINCARAVEGIRNLIAPDLRKEHAWVKFRSSLNLERSFVDLIMNYSTGPRHGDRKHIDGKIAMEIAKRSWIILDRYFALLSLKADKLPETEFPLLNGD